MKTDEDLHEALRALRDGELVVYPTDTVYGIGCDATDADAVHTLREVKGLPEDRGVSVLFATIDEAKAWTQWTPTAQRVAETFLPGPMTLILEASPDATPALLPEESTLAVRHLTQAPAARLARVRPVVATSANRHGEPTATTIEEARGAFGDDVAAYVDGGPLSGPSSTVVDARKERPRVIREGPLSETEILEATNLGR